MMDTAEEEGILSYVRNIINQNKVKLWESPFYDGSKVNEDEVIQLSLNLEPSSEIPQDQILHSLFQLQRNALDKLASRKALKDSGMTQLKIKYPKAMMTSSRRADLPKTLQIEAASETGKDLRATLAGLLGLPSPESIKLISGGKVLGESGLGHLSPGSSVMVVPIEANEELRASLERNEIVRSSKNDAELLKDDDRVEIGDQSGKSLKLPKEEKKALIMAMSLHERAKVTLEKKDFSLALVFLLEAHQEYQNCSPTILNAVDNYGLLNLDIAWCYLSLEQLAELPQAEGRLSECERCLNRIYGKEEANDRHRQARVIHTRLHLLQGVVAYHKGDLRLARRIFEGVKKELKSLIVPEDLIEELVALGYGEGESRLALRACDLNVPSAALFIDAKRKERSKIQEEDRKEKKREKKRKALGKTVDGKGFVNLGYLSTMKGMGFPEDLSVTALRQSNNDMGAAIDMIQNQPDVLLLASQEENEAKKRKTKKKKMASLDDDDIVQIMSITGLDDVERVKKVLCEQDGNVESAIESLLNEEGPSTKGDGSSHSENDETKKAPSTKEDGSSHSEDDEAEATKEFFERKKQSDEAYSRMKEEIGEGGEENHLNVTLEEEAQILERYTGYLNTNS